MGADLAISILIGAGYVIAASSIAIGLIALVVWLFVLPRAAVRHSRSAWWGDVALAIALLGILAAFASWLTGCSVAVSYQRAENPPSVQSADPPDAGSPASTPPTAG